MAVAYCIESVVLFRVEEFILFHSVVSFYTATVVNYVRCCYCGLVLYISSCSNVRSEQLLYTAIQ